MNKYDIVFDLGSNFVSAMAVGGFVVKDPSVVAVDITDKSIKGAGTSALKLYSNEMSNVALTHPIKDGAVIDPSGAGVLLTHTLSKLLGNSLFNKITVYVVVPCSMSKTEKGVIEGVFNSINVKQIKFLLTPIADSKRIFSEFCINSGIICNIGAEVADICAVVDDKIVCGCSVLSGGNDLTNAIIETIAAKYLVRLNFHEAENLKVACASLYPNDKSTFTVSGLNTSKGVEEQITVTSKELYSTVVDATKKYCQVIDGILASLPKDTAIQLKNDGIFLCGGGSQLTGIEKYFFSTLKLNVRIPTAPQEVSVLGGEMLAKLLVK